jgi:hypothetical protein
MRSVISEAGESGSKVKQNLTATMRSVISMAGESESKVKQNLVRIA